MRLVCPGEEDNVINIPIELIDALEQQASLLGINLKQAIILALEKGF